MSDAESLPPLDCRQREALLLAPFAMRTSDSRGRRLPEPEHPFRSPYQRDRDRVVYSTAFRRLMHKTQVLVTQTNDHHRTRLTHTLEVTQIARTLARRLRLNEDLAEAIALSHDLGHPPFGHAGEDALDACMAEHGGFEHNLHALRIVDLLEHPYPDRPGLNLSWEVREAMAQHSRRRQQVELDGFDPTAGVLLEAQTADAADSLAYVTHDVDDALVAGLISLDELLDVPWWRQTREAVRRQYGELTSKQLRPVMVRALIDCQVLDLIETSLARLRQERIGGLDDVRGHRGVLIAPGEAVQRSKAELSAFLRTRVYDHVRVVRMAHKGGRIVQALFAELCRAPELLPAHHRRRLNERPLPRVVCDYLAGMTDRYAQEEYLRLFHPTMPL